MTSQSAAPSSPHSPAPPSSTVTLKTWIGLLGSILGAFMAVLDIQITNASLRDIQAALGATLEEGSWISTAYLVAEIVVIPLTGWLSLVFSARRYVLVNAALFIFFSVCCAWAWNLGAMIVFRALQGFSGEFSSRWHLLIFCEICRLPSSLLVWQCLRLRRCSRLLLDPPLAAG